MNGCLLFIMTPETITGGAVPKAELMQSLGRMVRGLSALFWGLPVAFIVCVETATSVLHTFNILAPVAVTAWLAFGVWQLGHFQKQERIWILALDRAKLLCLVNLGLSPFLFWWSQLPGEPLFLAAVGLMAVSGLVFLSNLNLVLLRLAAMLPDESLRQETRQFTGLNRVLVVGVFLVALAWVVLLDFPDKMPVVVANLINSIPWNLNPGLLLFLVLLPLALTMAMIWKIKEMVMNSVFGTVR